MLLRRAIILMFVVLVSFPALAQEKILDFPINWDKRGVYGKFLPTNEQGKRGAWSCGQVAHAMIMRYHAMHNNLQIQGSHFYYMQGTGQRVSADFDEPFRWDEMLPSLKGIPLDDPRVDPVADFVYRFCVAMRTDWWDPARKAWVSDYHAKEAMARYYGIDVREYRRGPLAKWAEQHSWDELYERINRDIDAGLPCELVVTGIGKVCHEVIITGYRKVGDHYEYTIHFGGPRYDPSRSFRLDRPILGWNDPDHFLISWGIKPYPKGQRAPRYNTVLQEFGALDSFSRADIVWDGSEYALAMPSGRNGERSVVFQRLNASGRAIGERVVVASDCYKLPKPAIESGGDQYAVAWLGSGSSGSGIHFALLSESGKRVLPADVHISGALSWPGIAWSGSHFGLSYLEGTDVKLALIDGDGVTQRTTSVAEAKVAPSVVWSNGRYAVACIDNHSTEVCLRLLDEEGEPMGGLQTLFVDGAKGMRECRIASAEDGYGLAFIKDRPDGPPVAAFCLADRNGNFLPGSLVTVSDPKQNARTIDVSFHNGIFYVSYRHRPGSYGLYLGRVSREGEVLDTRWLGHRPDSVCHTQGPDGVNVVSLRNIPRGKGIEVVSCIVPRDEDGKAPRGLRPSVWAVTVAVLVGLGAVAALRRKTRSGTRQ